MGDLSEIVSKREFYNQRPLDDCEKAEKLFTNVVRAWIMVFQFAVLGLVISMVAQDNLESRS